VQVIWVALYGNAQNELGEKLRTVLFLVAIIALKHASMT
jgi:hypothetical protein